MALESRRLAHALPKVIRQRLSTVDHPLVSGRMGAQPSHLANARRMLDEVVARTEEAIRRFALVIPEETVVVALSGGKDSIVLCLALRELGVPIVPVVVDMGYAPLWGERVASIVEPLGFKPEVFRVRAMEASVDFSTTRGIAQRMEALESVKANPNLTPCTSCYSAKVLALKSVACSVGARVVALGQHMTDAMASLVKEALMNVDRWDNGHETFTYSNFRALVANFLSEASAFDKGTERSVLPLLKRIEWLVGAERIDTDEPPRQELVHGWPDISLIRPMFLVTEREIIRVKESASIVTEGSGCGHSQSEALYTPRELVHYTALRRLQSPVIDSWLTELVMAGIAPDGTARVRSRSRRCELLGERYKVAPGGLEKA